MRRRPPRSTQSRSSAASDMYNRQRQKLLLLVDGASEVVTDAELEERKHAAEQEAGVAREHRFLGEDRRAFGLNLHARQSHDLSLIHISEPTRLGMISYAVFCL